MAVIPGLRNLGHEVSVSLKPAWFTKQVLGQSGLQCKSLSQKTNKECSYDHHQKEIRQKAREIL